MNDASQEIDEEKMPDVGNRIQFEGLQLVVLPRHQINSFVSSCNQCWGSQSSAVCSALPRCGNVAQHDARLFTPDLDHGPTAQRIALMRLRGEL